MSTRGSSPHAEPFDPTAMGSVVAPIESLRPSRGGERYEELDGHRGFAVIAVIVFHVYQFCNVAHYLYKGTPAYTLLNSLDAIVPWFFVLTAFLLFEPIARSIIDGGSPISARGFLIRRAVRLLPVYYVAVITVWFFRQQSLPGDWRDLLEHLTFTQIFDEKRIFFTNGPAWSLSVEVFFYLILVALGVSLARMCRHVPSRKRRIAVLAAATTALAVISLTWKAWSFGVKHRSTTGSFTTWFGPTANLDLFAVGMALAVIVAALGDARPLNRRDRSVLRIVALAILTVAFATRQANTWSGVYFSAVCALGFGCLVAAAVLGPPGGRFAGVSTWRPLQWVGAISYSIYLWHEPVLLALQGWKGLVRQSPSAFLSDTAIVVLVSILAGWLSYSLIERPTSQLGGVFGRDGHLKRPPAKAADTRTEWNDQLDWESFRSGNPF